MTNDDTVRNVNIEDLSDGACCPVCDRPLNRESWTDKGGFVDQRAGGHTSYGCPTDGCSGEVCVYI